jgi:ABC-type Fe3+-hydroxamate transport system substrate-binding protein
MRTPFVDQLGDPIHILSSPKRIISLVPSQTELLFSLELQNEVVGITKFCVHPSHWKKSKTIIGGTKSFHYDVIDSLQPDLIIGNKEENYEEGILKLREKYPVWMSNVNSFEDSLAMINKLGALTNKPNMAKVLVSGIRKKFSQLSLLDIKRKKVLYLIWQNPWMAAAQKTFINAILEKCGLQNVVVADRYPVLTEKELTQLNPELVFLSSEPYPFKENHTKKLHAFFPKATVVLVDGKMFSWYGSRLLQSPDYFKSLLKSL